MMVLMADSISTVHIGIVSRMGNITKKLAGDDLSWWSAERKNLCGMESTRVLSFFGGVPPDFRNSALSGWRRTAEMQLAEKGNSFDRSEYHILRSLISMKF